MSARKKSHLGIAIILVFFGTVNLIRWHQANLDGPIEAITYGLISLAMIGFGVALVVVGRSKSKPSDQ